MVTVLPETEIPELFKPVHFRWAFSHRTGSAVGFWVKIHLGIDASVRTQPCSHTPIFMLSDCPLLCSSQLTAIFVPLVQDVLCSCNEQRWYHSQAFPKRQALCCLGTMHAPLWTPSQLSGRCYYRVSQVGKLRYEPFKRINKYRAFPPTSEIQTASTFKRCR